MKRAAACGGEWYHTRVIPVDQGANQTRTWSI